MVLKKFGKVVLAGLVTATFATSALASGTIKIGSVLSVTGPAAFLGDPEQKTLETYVAKINAEGGVLGKKLELVHYDDGGEAGKANSFAKRLIESDKVDIIIGGTTTGGSMAMVPLVEKAGVPFISLAGAVVVIEPVKKWVFKTPHTDRMAADKVFEDMRKNKITKVALLSESSGFGQSGRAETKLSAQRYGIELVADEQYGAKDTDVTTQLTKMRNIPGVQAIFVFGLGQGPAIVTKNYAQLGIKLPLYQSHGVASDEFIKLAGAAAEGVRLPTPAMLVEKQLANNDPQKALVSQYNSTYRNKYKAEPSTFGGYALDALYLAVDAIKRAGSTDKDKVRAALEQTKKYVGVTGEFNMSRTDHMGLNLQAFRMVEVKNGDWNLID